MKPKSPIFLYGEATRHVFRHNFQNFLIKSLIAVSSLQWIQLRKLKKRVKLQRNCSRNRLSQFLPQLDRHLLYPRMFLLIPFLRKILHKYRKLNLTCKVSMQKTALFFPTEFLNIYLKFQFINRPFRKPRRRSHQWLLIRRI